MKSPKKLFAFSLLVSFMFALQGCNVIVGIFEAGLWMGIILSVIVVVLIILAVVKLLKHLQK